jgi:peptidoglycan/xylan/chitin deacetylase (PgdA/CDA1 family)
MAAIPLTASSGSDLPSSATLRGELTLAEIVVASYQRPSGRRRANAGCAKRSASNRERGAIRLDGSKEGMDRKLINFRRGCYASLLVLFAPMPQHYSPSPVQDIALAAEEVERSTSESEHQSPSSDKRSTVEVPILVYHHIGQSVPVGSRAERRLTVTVESFDRQMQYLRENGYRVITFATLVDHLNEVGELLARPVIISFDDGWEDQFVYALPTLEKYHYSATFFVVTNSLGSPGFLSWSQLQTMRVEGMAIGSHSRSHPRLDKIDNPGILWDQIYTSKQILESQLGAAVDEFSYPYGSYNATTVSTVKLAGYKAARACCVGGVQSDAYALRAVMAPNDLVKFAKYLDPRSPSRRN